MAIKVGVPIIGVVENMAYYIDPDTGKKHRIFGESHGEKVAKVANAPLLAQIPINPELTQICDLGEIEDIEFSETLVLTEAFKKEMQSENNEVPGGSEKEEIKTWKFAETIEETKTPIIQTELIDEHDSAFSDVARQLIRRKENMGTFDQPDATGKFTGWCDDTMQIQFLLDGNIIQDAKFTTDGCGATIACGSMLTKMVKSMTLDQAMKISPDDLLEKLVSIPEDHEHCLSLAVTTLRKTVKDAKEKKLQH